MNRAVPHAAGKTAVEMNRNVQVLALKQGGGENSCVEFLIGFGIWFAISSFKITG